MRQNFDRSVNAILRHEGGYVNNRKDPGGSTKYGITIRTLRKWRGRKTTTRHVRNLTRSVAKQIYKKWYWNSVKADLLPSGVDHIVFDFAVNAGSRRSIKFMQKIIGVYPDGKIGPITLRTIGRYNSVAFVKKFTARRLRYYRSLRTWKYFGRGWASRTRRVSKEAISMTRVEPPRVRVPAPTRQIPKQADVTYARPRNTRGKQYSLAGIKFRMPEIF